MNSPANVEDEPHFLNLKIIVPFMLVSLIWGSTWLVIADQINAVPPSWSVTYRFIVAAIGMFILCKVLKEKLHMPLATHGLAMIIGLVQFALNFNFVYAAEHHITSGLVAVLFALLIIPNALFGKWFLGKSVSKNFWIGAGIASLGVTLLLVHEYRQAPGDPMEVVIGIFLTLIAVLLASSANIIQAAKRVSAYPIVVILAWSMLYGMVANALLSLIIAGAPSFDPRPSYIAGILYLGLIGSVVTFPLYFKLIREIGPGKAAYTSVFIPVVAMILSTIFEAYIWSGMAIIGAILAMLGLAQSMRSR
ncbi:EamA family transporter [Sphingorhabdus lutea]|uniref:EamA family transporter n=2 Tax=Sphingorhabdus lutea TaxID=1913578 RepID=A0A1L3JEP0_9SPHN|nr:EamA family transporter [Sphingorhabdus lutea]